MPIPAQLCTAQPPWGEITGRYTKPKTYWSALTEAKMKWVVRCGREDGSNGPDDLPIQIDADLNIPSAVVGQNIEHGTSVFAAVLRSNCSGNGWRKKVCSENNSTYSVSRTLR